jgi:hypothetical protein
VKIVGRKPILPAEYYTELLELRRIVRVARTLPSPKVLAGRWGVSVECARNYLNRELPKHLADLERG